MRKHGWQLPYHPLQVVAIAVFLALGFAFYVFFVPFVGKKLFQYVVMGLYTPLVTFVFLLYIWCAATDPGDPGISKSKKYGKIDENVEQHSEGSRQVGSDSELHDTMTREKPVHEGVSNIVTSEKLQNKPEGNSSSCWASNFLGLPFFWCHSHEQSSEQKSEEGMFFCSLCEVEVLKFSKHCRVCDKCVDGFDHHCRWLNNCIGRANYRRFFVLMVSAVILLILQWSIGVLVLIRCFVERRKFSVEIVSKLGSSFSLVPFVIVVASCTFLAMVATLPLAQLFFFHILLIKKGISTYDYIIALREQEEQDGGQQSPRMSPVSSLTGLSSASSFSAFRRGSWCTPPRLFLEDQYDVVPPEIAASLHSTDKKSREDDGTRRKSVGTVKISPWTLARLNAEEVSKAAARARKKSKILQPIARQDLPPGQETDSSYGSTSGRIIPRPDNKRRTSKRGRITGLTADLSREPLAKITAAASRSNGSILAAETSAILAPLQLEARSAFRPSRTASSTGNIASSPDSSLDSPDLHPYRISSGTEEIQGLTSLPVSGTTPQRGIQLSRSTSDGYEASGGEDSDRIPSRIVHRSSNWSSIVLNSRQSEMATDLKASSSGGRSTKNRLL